MTTSPAASLSARNLPKNPGPAGWNSLLDAAPMAERLTGTQHADWLIVGGGFAGLSAARRLVQLGGNAQKITLLEAGRIGEGPAGRNSGFMIDLPHVLSSEDYAGNLDNDKLQIRMNRQAMDFALDAADEYGLDDEIVCQSGKINGAATPKGEAANIAYASHLRRLNEPFEMLDAGQMQEQCGTPYYRQGLFTPGTTMLHPAAYVRGLAMGLGQRVNICEMSPVLHLHRKDGLWHAKSHDGQISAPKIIMAVNGHVESFGFFKRRLMHVFLYASMTRALERDEVRQLGGEPRWGVTPSDPIGSTIRRISGRSQDRIIVRNQATYAANMEVSEATAARKTRHHRTSFDNRFEMLRGIEMEYRWGGKLCLSLNDVPAFGEIEDGMFSACCQNGLGTARGTLSGILAADLASGNLRDNHQSLARMMALPAPKKLPPEPFASIGAKAVLWARHWRAGKEL